MVRSLISTATVMLLMTASAFAQDRGTALGGVPFGAAPSAVASAMDGLGLTRAALKDEGGAFPVDQTFAGKIDGRQVLVVAMYDDTEALEKMLITFITSDADCLPFYRDFKVALMREYGDTHADVEQWKAPLTPASTSATRWRRFAAAGDLSARPGAVTISTAPPGCRCRSPAT